MDQQTIDALALRLGKAHLSKRLRKQVNHAADIYSKNGYSSFHIENFSLLYTFLKFFLRTIGQFERGKVNSMAYQIEENSVQITNLPAQFQGLRILHLSDLHFGSILDNGKKLINIISGLSADLCVITGDLRFLTHGDYSSVLEGGKSLLKQLSFPLGVYGVLGNHDFIETVPPLEDLGVKILLNESASISIDDAKIWLAGIDDAHYYGCADVAKSLAKVPQEAPTILLSHTPEVYKEANDAGVDFMLCGHTHGGQICLPGNIPIITNASSPRSFCSGPWSYMGMKGYTSRGTGSSGLPVRFFCPPEVTVHVLSAN